MLAGIQPYRVAQESTSSSIRPGPDVRDHFDGQSYPTVFVGDQQWLTQNINRGCSDEGVPEDPYLPNSGGVYLWPEAIRIGETFGGGWRLPANPDWETLGDALENPAALPNMELAQGHWRGWLGDSHYCRWRGTYWSATEQGRHHAIIYAFTYTRDETITYSSYRGFRLMACAVRLVRE